ncbi:MAG: phospholipase D family protein [Bacteroidales bacterium]|nr:phospholipase D family protein [Bacteroidales bacterium]
MSSLTQYIADDAHYREVVSRMAGVKRELWIGTADVKDLYIKRGKESVPLLALLAKLLERGVNVRLIHAKEPGAAFRDDFDKYPILASALERVLCPRVHFKLMIMDLKTAYIGSANLTGAALGMKSQDRRNFEAGILTTDPQLVSRAVEQFDAVWMGRPCQTCKRRQFCTDRIA